MFRRYFASFAIVLFLVTSGFAQNIEKTGGYARILGMGNNPYIIDPYSTTVNPAWGAVYDNFLFGDLGAQGGGNSGQFVSANFGVGKNFTLGMILARNDFNGFSISRLDPGILLGQGVVGGLNSIVPGGAIALQNNFELMGTMTFGKTSVGLGVAYASTTNDFTPAVAGTEREGSASQIGFNVGVLAQITGSLKLDLGASLIMPNASFTPSATGQTESKVSQTFIGINARLFWKYSSKLSFVPVVGFLTASGTADNGTITPSVSTDLPSVTVITAGIGINYVVGDFLLAGGPAFATSSITTPAIPNGDPELSTSALTFPLWNLGLEWKMNDWLVGRLGYVGATNKVTTESSNGATPPAVDENIVTQFIPYGATIGLGFRLGDFSLDGTVNVEVLRQGLNNIGNFGPTFAYMSASYAIP